MVVNMHKIPQGDTNPVPILKSKRLEKKADTEIIELKLMCYPFKELTRGYSSELKLRSKNE